MKPLDSPILYGYNKSANYSDNSNGNSPNNIANTENLNLIDLIVSAVLQHFNFSFQFYLNIFVLVFVNIRIILLQITLANRRK